MNQESRIFCKLASAAASQQRRPWLQSSTQCLRSTPPSFHSPETRIRGCCRVLVGAKCEWLLSLFGLHCVPAAVANDRLVTGGFHVLIIALCLVGSFLYGHAQWWKTGFWTPLKFQTISNVIMACLQKSPESLLKSTTAWTAKLNCGVVAHQFWTDVTTHVS